MTIAVGYQNISIHFRSIWETWGVTLQFQLEKNSSSCSKRLNFQTTFGQPVRTTFENRMHVRQIIRMTVL